MEIQIDNPNGFAARLYEALAIHPPKGSTVVCHWAATYGVHMIAAYVCTQDGRIEMLSDTHDAGNFVFEDWLSRHNISSNVTYQDWLSLNEKQTPGAWNWGWAEFVDGRKTSLQLFDDALGPDGLPSARQIDHWRKQRFGDRKVTYPPL